MEHKCLKSTGICFCAGSISSSPVCQAVLLNLNIKNASNAVNHSAIFIILNAHSFFTADIDLRNGQRYLQWVLCHGIQRQPLQQLPASQNTTCTKWLPNLQWLQPAQGAPMTFFFLKSSKPKHGKHIFKENRPKLGSLSRFFFTNDVFLLQ